MDHTHAIRHIHLVASDHDIDPLALAADIADVLAGLPAEDRAAVVRHAYWCMPQVPTDSLRRAVGGIEPLRALAGRGPVTGTCRSCGRAVRARTRDAVDDDPPTHCPSCLVAASSIVEPSPSRRDVVAPFGWEFQDVPQPWQPQRQAVDERARRWAEHYPDRECA